MTLSIPTERVLQSYTANKPKVESIVLSKTQPGEVTTVQTPTESTKVNFSLAARAKQAVASPVAQYQQQLAESKKAKARARLAEIKERVDQLKRLVALFGSMAPKALLRELQQLTGELKTAAKELKEGWGASPSSASVTVNASAPSATEESVEDTAAETPLAAAPAIVQTSGDDTSAEVLTAAADADEASTSLSEPAAVAATAMAAVQQQTEKAQSLKQRREDQRQLQETSRELQLLFNRLKAMLRQEDRDKETEKQLGKISQQLTDTNNIASQLANGIDAMSLHISISV
ncbi:hypothetical protein [Alishewanella longhuensis]